MFFSYLIGVLKVGADGHRCERSKSPSVANSVTKRNTKSDQIRSCTVGGSAAVQFRNLISDFWVEPW